MRQPEEVRLRFDAASTRRSDLTWLWQPVAECINYKLFMMMRRCQDGTAPYLAVHRAPSSEIASLQQYLFLAASDQLTIQSHRRITRWSLSGIGVAGASTWNSLLNIYTTLRTVPVFGPLLKTFFSNYEDLATMRHLNSRFKLQYTYIITLRVTGGMEDEATRVRDVYCSSSVHSLVRSTAA